MSRMVFCARLQKDAEGLDFQLYQVSWVSVSSIIFLKKRGRSGNLSRRC